MQWCGKGLLGIQSNAFNHVFLEVLKDFEKWVIQHYLMIIKVLMILISKIWTFFFLIFGTSEQMAFLYVSYIIRIRNSWKTVFFKLSEALHGRTHFHVCVLCLGMRHAEGYSYITEMENWSICHFRFLTSRKPPHIHTSYSGDDDIPLLKVNRCVPFCQWIDLVPVSPDNVAQFSTWSHQERSRNFLWVTRSRKGS